MCRPGCWKRSSLTDPSRQATRMTGGISRGATGSGPSALQRTSGMEDGPSGHYEVGSDDASEGALEGSLDGPALVRFFQLRGRDLPWRGAGATPWRVLVSEVMLQQTPVARVLPVFQTWVDRWPDPRELAAAPSGEAVRAWGRLGYPRRALRLWETAGILSEQFGGEVPPDVGQLLTLPGIGHYTARAVAAFGFGQRVPVVDVNVRRVLNRVVRGVNDAGPATAADLALMETQLPLPAPEASLLSAAVMELGALLCTAAQPKCARVPAARLLPMGCRPDDPSRRSVAAPSHGTARIVRSADACSRYFATSRARRRRRISAPPGRTPISATAASARSSTTGSPSAAPTAGSRCPVEPTPGTGPRPPGTAPGTRHPAPAHGSRLTAHGSRPLGTPQPPGAAAAAAGPADKHLRPGSRNETGRRMR